MELCFIVHVKYHGGHTSTVFTNIIAFTAASVNHRWPQANIMHVWSLIYVIVISLNQLIKPPIWSNQREKKEKCFDMDHGGVPLLETSVPVSSLPFAVLLAICLSALASSPHPYLSCFHPMNSHHSCFLLLAPFCVHYIYRTRCATVLAAHPGKINRSCCRFLTN